VAETLACMAAEIEYMGRPAVPPCMLICAVNCRSGWRRDGVGGRNQEFVLRQQPASPAART